MKRDFTHENFEDFLKRSADSLRMKAPDKVWQNLSRELNKRKRRWIFGISAFLLITSAAGYYITTDLMRQQQPVAAPVQPLKNPSLPFDEKRNLTEASPSLQPTVLQPAVNNRLENNVTSQSSYPLSLISDVNEQVFAGVVSDNDNVVSSTTSAQNNFMPTPVDSYTEFEDQETPSKEIIKTEASTIAAFPLTIESVINSYKSKTKKGKVETQLYFTPTISYRKLTENKSYLRTLDPANIPANFLALNSSVNSNVTHKPDVGFELGFTTKIPLSKNLKLRSGLQFNVNRYDIKAFNSTMTVATIALNTGNGVDSLNRPTGYSNVGGYKSNWLQNLSFQVSAPIGVEYNFDGSDNVQFGVAATVQPTYVLGDRAYLISTDYKSYTQVPWLIRRWNVNTAFETFVKYKNWQFGPQVRYQLLSSFISKYPVKENLFDFGLKVGVTLK